MNKITTWIRNTFWTGYTPFERAFLYGMLALQLIVFYINPESLISIIAGVAGVASVVMCAKGRLEFYFVGFIQTFTYLYLAWNAKFYGEVIENVFYLVTMIWGIFVWKKHTVTEDDGSTHVEAKKFTAKQWFLSIMTTVIVTIAMGYWLTTIGSRQAYTDAATNVLAIFAQLLMVRRYREQWLWWIIIDVLCIKLWFVAGNWSMVAMYIAWTINCIYGWTNWTKEERK